MAFPSQKNAMHDNSPLQVRDGTLRVQKAKQTHIRWCEEWGVLPFAHAERGVVLVLVDDVEVAAVEEGEEAEHEQQCLRVAQEEVRRLPVLLAPRHTPPQ